MCQSKNKKKGEKEEHDDDGNNNILTQEIDSWSNFEYALREENRLLFNRMLYGCKENEDYTRAANSKGEFFSAESWRYNTASFHIIKNSLTLGQ